MQIGHKPQLSNTIFSGGCRQLATAVSKYALIRFSFSSKEACAAAYLSSTNIEIAVTVVWLGYESFLFEILRFLFSRENSNFEFEYF